MAELIATINGKEITTDDFNAFLKQVPQQQRAYITHPEAQEYFKEQMLAVYLFEAYGEAEGIDKSEEFEKRMAEVRRNVLSQLAMEKLLESVTVSEEEKKEFFEANKSKFAKGPSASAKHILMADEEAINKVKADIEAGTISFEDAAKANSTCPSASKGGSLGTFGRGQMVKEFDEVVFTGEIGKVLGPVQTQFGYHLIVINERNDGEESTYEEVADRINAELKNEKQQRLYTDTLIALQEKYQK